MTDWMAEEERKSKLIKVIWRIAVQLFYIGVTIFIFVSLQGRQEHLMVALIGLVYVTLRGTVAGGARGVIALSAALQSELDCIKGAVIPGYEPDYELRDETKREADDFKQVIFIDSCGLGVISLICMFALFSTLV